MRCCWRLGGKLTWIEAPAVQLLLIPLLWEQRQPLFACWLVELWICIPCPQHHPCGQNRLSTWRALVSQSISDACDATARPDECACARVLILVRPQHLKALANERLVEERKTVMKKMNTRHSSGPRAQLRAIWLSWPKTNKHMISKLLRYQLPGSPCNCLAWVLSLHDRGDPDNDETQLRRIATLGDQRCDFIRGAWVTDADVVEILSEQVADSTRFFEVKSCENAHTRGWIKAAYVVSTGPEEQA